MIFAFQMSASSLRQLSIFNEPAWADASPASNANAATSAPIAALNVRLMLRSLVRAFALDPADACAAHRIVYPAFRSSQPRDGFAHADDTAGNQDCRLDLAAGLAQRRIRFGIADAGDCCDDPARPLAQFR